MEDNDLKDAPYSRDEYEEMKDRLTDQIDNLLRQRDETMAELDKAYAEIERLKAIEMSYGELEKRFLSKCKG